MWRSKKFIIVAVLAAVVLSGSIGGIVVAADNGDEGEPESRYEALLKRVCEIYQEKTGVAIDQEALKDAFAQARGEMRTEALDRYLQHLVEEGRITQEEADQFKAWWQARPDIEAYRQQLREWQQARPGMPPELKEWLEASPDMPDRFGFGGHRRMRGFGIMRGFGGMHGWGCPRAPVE